MEYSLEVKNFTKKYRGNKTPSTNNVSFSVPKGSFFGLIGANGSGKTTTIKSIIGAFVNYDGEILINGVNNNASGARLKIGYIPEVANFPSGLSTKKYLHHMAMLSGVEKEKVDELINEKLESFGIAHLARKRPTTFSSGQKKKVLLAQALMHDPEILIMDEPAANLDPKARIEFFRHLKDIHKQGKTIFITSHILIELNEYVDSVAILDNGLLVYSGSIIDAKNNSKFVIEFKNKTIVNKVAKILKEYKHTTDENKVSIEIVSNKFNPEKLLKEITKIAMPISYHTDHMSLEKIYMKYAHMAEKDNQ